MQDFVRFAAIAMNAARSPARAIAGALLSLCARKFFRGSRLEAGGVACVCRVCANISAISKGQGPANNSSTN